MSELVSVVYDGPHAAVDIHDSLDGLPVAGAQGVKVGQSVDVPEHVAQSLLESGNFKKPEAKPEAQEKVDE